MTGFSAIDLTQLPAPKIIEPLDFETIFVDVREDLLRRAPEYSALVESDPGIKLLEVAAYRELVLRARINDAAKAVMLAFAEDEDLDHLGALFGVERQIIDPGDPAASPPRPSDSENNERLRRRVQLSLEGHSTAGPEGSYIFHALGASAQVKDVDVDSPSPGEVVVTVLSTVGDGAPTTELLENVLTALSADDVRPLTDRVRVQRADIIRYRVEATLTLFEGPDTRVVLQAAQDALNRFVISQHLLGRDITLSGIYAALHQPGVQNVRLELPTQSQIVANRQAAFCEGIELVIDPVRDA